MADQPAPPEKPKPEPEKLENRYILKFEPVGVFSETELFVKGFLRGKIWVSDQTTVTFRSLTGEETDKIDEVVKIKPGMSQREYNTQTTYYNLAYGVEAIGEEKLSGTAEEKVKRLKSMASAVVARISLAWLEFNGHVDELFVGKGGLELAKKS
jgi:hypothetical protein